MVGAVVAGAPVDDVVAPVVVVVAGGDVVLVEELALWPLEHAAQNRQVATAVKKVTRDRRTTRS